MHIAIEGMDGAGKTSQAKLLAEKIGGEFIAKSFHEMHDISGIYDSFVTIDKYTGGDVPGIYGIRQNYFFGKLENKNLVTDRFYISNYWSRAADLTIEYFKSISMAWGEPDLMIILYADSQTLYHRIYSRNNQDKDLAKLQMSEMAYGLMFQFAEQMKFKVLVIDNSSIEFEETSDVIYYAYKFGIQKCVEKFPDLCKVLQPSAKVIKNETGEFVCYGNELVECINRSKNIKIPDNIERIREKAFCKCNGDLRINIPKSVTAISSFAFEDANIEYFIAEKQNLAYSSINGILYDKKIDKLIKVPNLMETVTIDKVKRLGNCSFEGCRNLKAINIPDTVVEAGYAAFSFCTELTEIKFKGRNLEFLAPGCFYGCENIKRIHIQSIQYETKNGYIVDKKGNVFWCVNRIDNDSLLIENGTYIYPYAFYCKLDVNDLYIDISKVGAFAFERCKIKNVFLKGRVTDIGERCFGNVDVSKVVISEGVNINYSWDNSFRENTNFFLSESSYDTYISNKNWMNKRLWFPFGKKESQKLCGNACIDYIFQEPENKNDSTDMLWIFELTSYIEGKMGRKTKVFYYNSRLMNDYKEKINQDLPEMKELDWCINQFGEFVEKKFYMEDLRVLCKEFNHVILCIRSERLFGDKKFDGNNHYVILDSIFEDRVTLVSPGRECYYKVILQLREVIALLHGNGQWIIGVE